MILGVIKHVTQVTSIAFYTLEVECLEINLINYHLLQNSSSFHLAAPSHPRPSFWLPVILQKFKLDPQSKPLGNLLFSLFIKYFIILLSHPQFSLFHFISNFKRRKSDAHILTDPINSISQT